MSDAEGESGEKALGRKTRRLTIMILAVVVAAVVVISVLFVYYSPDYSWNASIRDSDGDGYADSEDEFPDDPDEWCDSDSDGCGDNGDAFPNDASETSDFDNDGIGDNADFFDFGNGKVAVSINYYKEDGSADFLTWGDPFFVITFDTDNDGTTDRTFQSDVFLDVEELVLPYSAKMDVPDDLTSFKFSIEVWESDLEGDYIMDYCPSATGTGYVHTVQSPFIYSWEYDGMSDGVADELDCELHYSTLVTM